MATYTKTVPSGYWGYYHGEWTNGTTYNLGISLGTDEWPYKITFTGKAINEKNDGSGGQFQLALCDKDAPKTTYVNLPNIMLPAPSGKHGSDEGGWYWNSTEAPLNGMNSTSNGDAWNKFKGKTLGLRHIKDYKCYANGCVVTIETNYEEATAAITAGVGGTATFNDGTTSKSMTRETTQRITVTPNEGYWIDTISATSGTLTGVTAGATSLTYDFTMATPSEYANITVTFAKQPYSVTTITEPSGYGEVNVSPEGQPIGYHYFGDTITLSQSPTQGHEFIGFSVDDGSQITNNQFTMPSHNVTVTAYYDGAFQNLYKSAVPPEAGAVIQPSDGKIRAERLVTVSQKARAGWDFQYYTLNQNSIAGNTFTMPTSDAAVSAVYSAGDYYFKLEKNLPNAPNPTIIGATRRGNSNVYDTHFGQVVIIDSHATPETEYKFLYCTMSLYDQNEAARVSNLYSAENAALSGLNAGDLDYNITNANKETYQKLLALNDSSDGFIYYDESPVYNNSVRLFQRQSFDMPAANVKINVVYEPHRIDWNQYVGLTVRQSEYVLTFKKTGEATDNMGYNFDYCIYRDFEDENKRMRIATFPSNSDTVTFQMTDADIEITHTYTLVARYQNISTDTTILSDGISVEYTSKPVHKTVGYYINGNFMECVPYYYDGNEWVEVEPYFYDGTAFQLCSGDGTMLT